MLEWVLDDMVDLDLELLHDTTDDDELPAHVYRACLFLTITGRQIRLLWSDSDSVLLPIAASPSTALINFVGADSFGCAYPALTLNRRGLRRKFSELNQCDNDVLHGLMGPAQFALRRFPRTVPNASRTFPCTRQSFTCQHQGRFFGDDGSLVQLFEPHRLTVRGLREDHQPPFGIAAAWRFSINSIQCEGSCSTTDPILPPQITAVSAVVLGRGYELNNTFVGWRGLYRKV